MPRPSGATQAKRQRERARQERAQEKQAERAQRKEQRKIEGDRARDTGEDPDLIGIVPGPQPPPIY